MPEPSLDHWTFVFLFAGAQGLFLTCILFLQKKGHVPASRVLATIMLLFSITIFYYVAFWTGYTKFLPRVFNIVLILPLLFGPLFLLYFKLLHQDALRWKDAWHLLPFGFFLVYNSPIYLGWSPAEFPTLFNPTTYYGRLILFNGQTLAYAVYLFGYLRRHHSGSSQHRWMQKAAFCYTGFAVSLATYYLLFLTIDFNLTHDYAVTFFMSVFVYLAGYLGYRHPEALLGKDVPEQKEATKYAKSGLTSAEAAFYQKKIIRYMEEQRPYLDCELKMDGLAQRLNLSKHTFSQVINEHFQQNFADFINHYRVCEAQRRLADPANRREKILAIAYDAGFRNKASFYNAFNKHAGTSPTRYRQKALAAQKRKIA